jgi:hypothetical protein
MHEIQEVFAPRVLHKEELLGSNVRVNQHRRFLLKF